MYAPLSLYLSIYLASISPYRYIGRSSGACRVKNIKSSLNAQKVWAPCFRHCPLNVSKILWNKRVIIFQTVSFILCHFVLSNIYINFSPINDNNK